MGHAGPSGPWGFGVCGGRQVPREGHKRLVDRAVRYDAIRLQQIGRQNNLNIKGGKLTEINYGKETKT